MRRLNYTILAVLVSISLPGLPAKGDLFQAEDPRFGPNSLTVDTRTGLSWLDLTFSRNLSYLQAEAGMQPGGQFDGFRHATAAEVLSLYNSAGFGEGFFAQSSPEFQDAVSLISLIGVTTPNNSAAITGTIESPPPGPVAILAYLSYGSKNGVPGYFVSATVGAAQYGLDTHFLSVGNWMVVVPEPSICMLLFAGGALMLLLPGRKA